MERTWWWLAAAIAGLGIGGWLVWRRIQWGKPQSIAIDRKRRAEFSDEGRH